MSMDTRSWSAWELQDYTPQFYLCLVGNSLPTAAIEIGSLLFTLWLR